MAWSPKDVEPGEDVIRRAKAMFDEDAAKTTDRGTCVLGAGIKIGALVLRSPLQGNVGGYRAAQRAMGFLRTKGIACEWYDGVMD
jgi:hypothetical protein